MRDQANVRSIDAIAELRGRIVEASESMARTIDECVNRTTRLLAWVQGPQLQHWRGQKRKRDQRLASARSDLERAKISRPDADPRSFVDQQRAIRKAKAAADEATEKLKLIARWSRELDRQVTLFRGGLRPLSTAVEADLPRAAGWLAELVRHLEGYLEVAPPMPETTPSEDEQQLNSRGRHGTDGATEEVEP
ncbi:MAG: hypothetical protein QF561_00915 [Phycisphaerales bacterium]|jgi:hypothetical protein|nr:hypothetical protein [Phycisphaerales bacterium]